VPLQVAEPAGTLLECRDYLAPIITPHEALLALTQQPFEAQHYTLGFESVLNYAQGQGKGQQQGSRPGAAGSALASAAAAELGGNIRTDEEFEQMGAAGGAAGGASTAAGGDPTAGDLAAGSSSSSSKALALSGQEQLQLMKAQAAEGKAVVVRTAAQYLAVKRSYQGLETPLTGAEAKPAELAVAGRTGRAAVYIDEPAA
jgi:diphthamide biosynthesis protein 2